MLGIQIKGEGKISSIGCISGKHRRAWYPYVVAMDTFSSTKKRNTRLGLGTNQIYNKDQLFVHMTWTPKRKHPTLKDHVKVMPFFFLFKELKVFLSSFVLCF